MWSSKGMEHNRKMLGDNRMKPILSIILPSIRPEGLQKLYESVDTTRSWEMIVCSPYGLPPFFDNKKNVKYIRDFGSPVRCSNIAVSLAEGELLTAVADDAVYCSGALDESIEMFYKMGPSDYNVVSHMYYESQNRSNEQLQGMDYYRLNGSEWTKSPYFPDNWVLFNSTIMYTHVFRMFGGWDSNFQATALSHSDLAVRCQAFGVNVKVYPKAITSCDHGQIDHKPIETAQTFEDLTYFRSKYHNPNWRNNVEFCIDPENWRRSSAVWEKRFGKIG